jgi:putative addiction module killer protein
MFMRVVEYLDIQGKSPFRRWFAGLDAAAAAKVVVSLRRLELDNVSGLKSVGQGVHEHRIHWGPGYRIYFGFDGQEVIILLAGGTKQRQSKDIAEAIARWQDYRRRKQP